MVLNFFKKILGHLENGEPLVLMVVIQSTGSSPGRQGFLLAAGAGMQEGTIGGGIMEYKWITAAREWLIAGRFKPFTKLQVHRAGEGENRSGMICSGEQVIAFYYLDQEDITAVKNILAPGNPAVCYYENGISAAPAEASGQSVSSGDLWWRFIQPVAPPAKVYIFGAGHVGIALYHALSRLEANIRLFDNRKDLVLPEPGLPTECIDYENSSSYIPEGEHNYVLVMSVGYRTDEAILRSLHSRKFAYLGLLGSRQKVQALMAQLREQGLQTGWLDAISAPAGLDIKSETAAEIAISIAAQLIQVKNAGLRQG